MCMCIWLENVSLCVRERDMHVLVFCLPLPKVELLQLAASVCTKPSSKVHSKMKTLSFSSQLHCKPILASVEVDFLWFCANLATFWHLTDVLIVTRDAFYLHKCMHVLLLSVHIPTRAAYYCRSVDDTEMRLRHVFFMMYSKVNTMTGEATHYSPIM